MGRLQGDIDIIQAELKFLRSRYQQALREKDFRQLKGISLWISKLEKKLEHVQQKRAKSALDFIKEYKSGKNAF
ncbi:MAG TPA: hypothetical protein VEB63_00340 [Chitinophagaceae bacterium]|nr:hypothetical protein [Chitinophagaceae bacterium]